MEIFSFDDLEANLALVAEEDQNDQITELPGAINIPIRSRSDSIGARLGSSYEIDIDRSFVSSLNRTEGAHFYKPKMSDFEPIKVLGKGSYGKVLLVREKATGRLFAQKQLKKASIIVENKDKNVERTLTEKNILEMVSHPNIVKLYYAFQDRNKVYLILEYLQGGELFHHLAQERILSEKNASYYIAQMVLALNYLHTKIGVVYRDLKPENCLLNKEGELVLTDFGLSKVADDQELNSIIGTPQYMAPEILQGKNYDYSVDWWSLGAVCFDLLTGSPPFPGNNNKKIMDRIVHEKLKFPFYLSLDAKDLLRKLLNKNPEKRINGDDDLDKLKSHRFFRYLDWQEMESQVKTSMPPIIPVITDPILAENFDPEFTAMLFTPPPSPTNQFLNAKENGDIFHLNGFSYTNESYLV